MEISVKTWKFELELLDLLFYRRQHFNVRIPKVSIKCVDTSYKLEKHKLLIVEEAITNM